MAKGALFIGWGALIPGREKAAKSVLNDAMQFCIRLQQEGKIDNFEAVALEPHGGDLEGFVLVKGDKEVIGKLRLDEEFVRIIVGVQLVHSKVGVVGAYVGAEMQSLFEIWDQQEEKLI
ncbi:MAG TPA: hypothetical protein VF648_17050 [Pyrinomonadaceae bacterium]|jgi:hypothetical protein